MTSSNGNIFRVTGPLCGEFTGPGEFPTQRPVTQSFDVSFDLRLNKQLSKQPWDWWFETPSWSLWRQCNGGSLNPPGCKSMGPYPLSYFTKSKVCFFRLEALARKDTGCAGNSPETSVTKFHMRLKYIFFTRLPTGWTLECAYMYV